MDKQSQWLKSSGKKCTPILRFAHENSILLATSDREQILYGEKKKKVGGCLFKMLMVMMY